MASIELQTKAVVARIDQYLEGTPLEGQGKEFLNAGIQNGVDPFFLVAIAKSETQLGTYAPSQRIHNAFGMGPGINYPSWAAGIQAAANNLRTNAAYKGAETVDAIGARWAPPSAGNDPTGLNLNWPRNVKAAYAELTGQQPGQVKGEGTLKRVLGIADTGFGPNIPGVDLPGIPNPVGAIRDGIDGVVDVLRAITDPDTWKRAGMGIGGAMLIGIAFIIIALQSGAVGKVASALPAAKIAKAVS